MGPSCRLQRDLLKAPADLLETRDMRPRHRLAVLATLSLLGAGLWWVSVIAPPGDTVPDDTEAAERSGPQGLSQ